jgi:hypothetical protein
MARRGLERLLLAAAMLWPTTGGCARSEPAPAEADDIEAAVKRADEDAANIKGRKDERGARR